LNFICIQEEEEKEEIEGKGKREVESDGREQDVVSSVSTLQVIVKAWFD
jgi:hypothetical protein